MGDLSLYVDANKFPWKSYIATGVTLIGILAVSLFVLPSRTEAQNDSVGAARIDSPDGKLRTEDPKFILKEEQKAGTFAVRIFVHEDGRYDCRLDILYNAENLFSRFIPGFAWLAVEIPAGTDLTRDGMDSLG